MRSLTSCNGDDVAIETGERPLSNGVLEVHGKLVDESTVETGEGPPSNGVLGELGILVEEPMLETGERPPSKGIGEHGNPMESHKTFCSFSLTVDGAFSSTEHSAEAQGEPIVSQT